MQAGRHCISLHRLPLLSPSSLLPLLPPPQRDYEAMCKDYYTLQFMDPSVDTTPIAPALAAFFDDVLDSSVSTLNFKVGRRRGRQEGLLRLGG